MFLLPSEWLIFLNISIPLGSIRNTRWISLFAGNVTIHRGVHLIKATAVKRILPKGLWRLHNRSKNAFYAYVLPCLTSCYTCNLCIYTSVILLYYRVSNETFSVSSVTSRKLSTLSFKVVINIFNLIGSGKNGWQRMSCLKWVMETRKIFTIFYSRIWIKNGVHIRKHIKVQTVSLQPLWLVRLVQNWQWESCKNCVGFCIRGRPS